MADGRQRTALAIFAIALVALGYSTGRRRPTPQRVATSGVNGYVLVYAQDAMSRSFSVTADVTLAKRVGNRSWYCSWTCRSSKSVSYAVPKSGSA